MRITVFITLVAVFVLISLAFAQVLTTTDSTITVDKKYTSIVAGNYSASERKCDGQVCIDHVTGKYLDTDIRMAQTNCTNRDATTGECLRRVNRTTEDITADRNAQVKQKLEEYAQGILDDQAKSIPATTTNGGKIVVK